MCHSFSVLVHQLASVVHKLFTFQASSPKPLGQCEPSLAGMFLGWSSIKFLFFVPVGYSTEPIICSDWLIFQRSSSLKLIMNWLNPNCNDHWNVLYQVSVFYADRKSKMSVTALHRLTLDPMGKYSNGFFQKIKIWLKPNCTWMFIGWSSTTLGSLFRYEIQNGGYDRI